MIEMTEMTDMEVRTYPRKVFRCRARLAVEDKLPVDAWTVDISIGGMSLMLENHVDPGQYCVVKFTATLGGKERPFSTIARSIYSVCSCTGQHRTGFQFLQLSDENIAFINDLPI